MSETFETHPLGKDVLAFIRQHKERMTHIADEHEWLRQNFQSLLDADMPEGHWFISIGNERYEREA